MHNTDWGGHVRRKYGDTQKHSFLKHRKSLFRTNHSTRSEDRIPLHGPPSDAPGYFRSCLVLPDNQKIDVQSIGFYTSVAYKFSSCIDSLAVSGAYALVNAHHPQNL